MYGSTFVCLVVIAGAYAQKPLFPKTLTNSNTANVQTIVGCTHPKNTQTGRSGSKMSCADLQTLARSIATGQKQCYDSFSKNQPSAPATAIFTCPYQGAVVNVNRTTGPGKKRSARQYGRPTPPARPTTFTNQSACPSQCYQPINAGKLLTKRVLTLGSTLIGGPRSPPTTDAQNGIGNCGYTTTLNSIYIEEIIGDYRVIASNGLPDHDYNQKTPNKACETYKIMVVPINPPAPSSVGSALPGGAIGIAKSGALIFNHLSAEPVCNAAYVSEKATFGDCEGHSQQQGEWHYHGPSKCLKQSAQTISPGEICPIIGYLMDGYPIRSECANRKSCYKVKANVTLSCTAVVDGRHRVAVTPGCDSNDYEYVPASNCQLDSATGYQESTGYTYYLTDSYPYIMPLMRGTAGSICVVQL